MKKLFAMMLALVMVLCLLPNVALAEGEITTFEGLKAAVNADGTYVLGSDITIDEMLEIKAGIDVTIDGNRHTLTYASSYTGTMFKVDEGGKLTLKNVTINGGDDWKLKPGVEEGWEKASKQNERCTVDISSNFSSSVTPKTTVIVNNKGNLTLGQGTKITNFVCGSAPAILKQNGGETLLDGCELSHNFIAKGNGGVIRADNNAYITMNSGLINDNVGVDCNGTFIMVYNQSLFTMNGGTVSNNRGYRGENNGWNMAVYVHKLSTFIMNGGTIAYNKGTTAGGAGTNYSEGARIIINFGSTVKDNKGPLYGEDVDIQVGSQTFIDPSVECNAYSIFKVLETGQSYDSFAQAINKTTGDVTILVGKNMDLGQYGESNENNKNIGDRNIAVCMQGHQMYMQPLKLNGSNKWVNDGEKEPVEDGRYTVNDEAFKKAFNFGSGSVTIGNYAIILDPNGGSVNPVVVLADRTGKIMSELPTPTREGNYSFNGWYTAADGGMQIGNGIEFSSNTTIYAQWYFTNYDPYPDAPYYYYTPASNPAPAPLPPQTGDMPLWYAVAQFLGLVK